MDCRRTTHRMDQKIAVSLKNIINPELKRGRGREESKSRLKSIKLWMERKILLQRFYFNPKSHWRALWKLIFQKKPQKI